MIGRINVGYQLTLLHTKYTNSMPCGFKERIFCFSYCKAMADNYTPWRNQCVPKGHGWEITKHCYKRNVKALDLMVAEKKLFYVLRTVIQ